MSKHLAIEIDGLTVRYPGTKSPTVDKVSFTVEEGSITTLLGPNGAGKSTLIKALLGLVEYKGEIRLFGDSPELHYKNIGYVPQRVNFDYKIPITVDEFLRLALISCKNCHKSKKKLIKQALEQVDLLKVINRNLIQLSGGQLQRILIARALVHQPRLLILDEPEAGIDVGAEQSLFQLLQKLKKEHQVTILMASHELDVVYGFSDQVVCINHRLVCTGKPNRVLTPDTFKQLYGGNITFYTHGHQSRH